MKLYFNRQAATTPRVARLLPTVFWVGAAAVVLQILIPSALFDHAGYFDAQVQVEAARAVLRGESPYGGYFQSPLWVCFLVLPFAWLPGELAYTAWWWGNLVLWLAAAALLLRAYRAPWGPLRTAVAAGLLAVFPPVVWSLHGQLDAVMALGFALFLTLLPRHPTTAGVALALLLVKPHLAVVPLIALGLWALRARARAVLIGLGCGAAALLVTSLLLQPSWPAAWLDALLHPPEKILRERPLFAPTPTALAGQWLPEQAAAAVGALVALAAAVGLAWWLLRRPALPSPERATALVAAALFLITPYAQGYDLSLLVAPLAFAMAAAARSTGRPRALLVGGCVLIYLAALPVAYAGWPQPTLLVTALIALGLWWLCPATEETPAR